MTRPEPPCKKLIVNQKTFRGESSVVQSTTQHSFFRRNTPAPSLNIVQAMQRSPCFTTTARPSIVLACFLHNYSFIYRQSTANQVDHQSTPLRHHDVARVTRGKFEPVHGAYIPLPEQVIDTNRRIRNYNARLVSYRKSKIRPTPECSPTEMPVEIGVRRAISRRQGESRAEHTRCWLRGTRAILSKHRTPYSEIHETRPSLEHYAAGSERVEELTRGQGCSCPRTGVDGSGHRDPTRDNLPLSPCQHHQTQDLVTTSWSVRTRIPSRDKAVLHYFEPRCIHNVLRVQFVAELEGMSQTNYYPRCRGEGGR